MLVLNGVCACVRAIRRSLFANSVAVTLRPQRSRNHSSVLRQHGLSLTLPSLLFTADEIFAKFNCHHHEPAALINNSCDLNPNTLNFITFSDTFDRPSCSTAICLTIY